VLLVALLVIGGLVWLFIAQPWRGFAAPVDPTSSPSPSTSSSAAPSDAPSDAPSEEASAEEPAPPAEGEEPSPDLTPTAESCTPGALLIEALTDQASYSQGQNPALSIRLTNTSETDCTLNVGTSAQAFTVSSGSDVWWRSTDCQTEPSDMIVLLAAGQQVTSSAPLTWDRTRSSVDTCQSERPVAPGGGATYHLSVAIGGISSTNTAPFQLN
jgi:cytoskeletal protein RodZ